MRVRTFQLRLLAALLVALWAAAAVAVVLGYGPGGPADIFVRGSALLPPLIAALAVVWPPAAREARASAVIAWLAIGSMLVLAPSIGELLRSLSAGGRQTLLPSPETIYATLLALFTTCLFVGLGLAREMLGETALRRRRFLLGSIIALGLTGGTAAAFGGASVINEVALREREPTSSAWGPTDPAILPPPCDGELLAGPSASVDAIASGSVDGERLGSVVLDGRRSGRDETWSAQIATVFRSGTEHYTRIGERGWSALGEGPWSRLPAGSVAGLETLDRAVVLRALSPGDRVAAEDRGLELVGGARARHCRTAIGGSTALTAFPLLRWIVGGDALDRAAGIEAWRGDVDWWVFGDGQLGLATVTVSGPPGEWPLSGLQGSLSARLTALDRRQPQAIEPPGP